MNSVRVFVLFNFFLVRWGNNTYTFTDTVTHENQWSVVFINWVPFWYIFKSKDSGALTMYECYKCLLNIRIDKIKTKHYYFYRPTKSFNLRNFPNSIENHSVWHHEPENARCLHSIDNFVSLEIHESLVVALHFSLDQTDKLYSPLIVDELGAFVRTAMCSSGHSANSAHTLAYLLLSIWSYIKCT